MSHPTIKQLKCLMALDAYQHFGQAAIACHISQSAFSLAIKELENKLHVQLVDRTNKQIIFTDIGMDIVSQARLCLSDLDTLISLAMNTQQPLTGKLTLGVIPSIAPFLLPQFIQDVSQSYPKLKLYLREDKTHIIHEQLLSGKLDLILMALPFDMKGVEQIHLFDDSFIFAYHQHSQWFQPSQQSFDINALPEESLLLLDDGHCLRDHALTACKLHHTEKINQFSATSLETLLQMVACDLGVTFIPYMAKASLQAKNLHISLLDLPQNMNRSIGLAWRKGSAREKEFRLLGDILKSIAT